MRVSIIRALISALTIIAAALLVIFPRIIMPRLLGCDVPLAAVESGSMEPTIHIGDLILAERPPRPLHEGDVIIFSRGGRLVVHRIIAVIQQDGITLYRTKGDHNLLPDPAPVGESQVHGLVVIRIPLAGYLPLLFMRQ